MKRIIISFALFLFAPTLYAASFPHKSAVFTTTTNGPMMEVVTDSYIYFDGNKKKAVSAEWETQKSPMGEKHKLNITKDDTIYSVNLDRKKCTKTNIQTVTDSIRDPEEFSESIKKQMNMKKNGSCKGAGLKGVKYSSSFGEVCLYKDMFLLWQSAMGVKTQVTKVKFDTKLPKDKITVPAGIKCVDGPDLSKGWQGMMPSRDNASSSSDAASDRGQDQPPPNMDEAMQKAKDAMKSLGDMFK